MKKVLLIGGSPCCGKSTLAQHLSEEWHCKVIKVDDYMGKHIQESDENLYPILFKWKTQPWYQLFERPVDIQLEEEIQFYEEEWDFLMKDIFQSIDDNLVIIEGCALLPKLISKIDYEIKVIYMIPSPEFQMKHYKLRTWAFDILKGSSNPEEAFDLWMQRDIQFAKYIKSEAVKYNYPVILIDGKTSVKETANKIKKNILGEDK